MIDLGHWFSENYAVASNEPLKEQDIDEIQKKLEEEYEG